MGRPVGSPVRANSVKERRNQAQVFIGPGYGDDANKNVSYTVYWREEVKLAFSSPFFAWEVDDEGLDFEDVWLSSGSF